MNSLEDRIRYRLGALMLETEALQLENVQLRQKLVESDSKKDEPSKPKTE